MIPARYAASRFPGKLMQDLGGKTVIQRTYEATVATKLFDDVIVVTDSDIIYKEIVNNGGKVMMSKKDHDCGSDRIAEAVEFMDIDVVINVQGDEPFTDKDSLAKLIEVFKDDPNKEVDLASLAEMVNTFKCLDTDLSAAVASWIADKQLPNGSFPASTKSDFAYTRGTSKIFEVLALNYSEYKSEIHNWRPI